MRLNRIGPLHLPVSNPCRTNTAIPRYSAAFYDLGTSYMHGLIKPIIHSAPYQASSILPTMFPSQAHMFFFKPIKSI